jgi:hypothetical protein
MTTVRLEHAITDFGRWKQAFDRDPIDRAGSGVVAHRIYRPADDPAYVMVDLDVESHAAAERVCAKLEQLWRSREAAPALAGKTRVRIIETVEAATY